VLCREQAIKLWNARSQFEGAGVKLVLVVHEWIDREIKGFAPEYWGERGQQVGLFSPRLTASQRQRQLVAFCPPAAPAAATSPAPHSPMRNRPPAQCTHPLYSCRR
jgi:hypothetical protein